MSGVAEPAVTRAEAMAHLNQTAALPESDEAELDRFIRAASAAAERFKCQVFAEREVVEVHDPGRDGVVFLRAVPVLTEHPVQVSVDGGPVSTGHWLSGAIGMLTVPEAANRQMTVTFRAGMDPVPEEYRVGVLMIVAHLWQTQRRPLGQRTRLGGQDDDSVMVAGFAVPRAALEMLGPRGVT